MYDAVEYLFSQLDDGAGITPDAGSVELCIPWGKWGQGNFFGRGITTTVQYREIGA